MIKKVLFIAAAILIASPTLGFAQDDIILSFVQNAPTQTTATAAPADATGSLFIFANNGFDFDSLDLNIANSDTSVIEFTGGNFFNSAVVSPPFIDSTRFEPNGTEFLLNATTPTALANLALVNVSNGEGVRSLFATIDADFDTGANAFLIGQVDFDIVGTGTANVSLSLGELGAFDNTLGDEGDLFPTLGAASITVAEPLVIPEPSSAILVILGSMGLAAARRRKA